MADQSAADPPEAVIKALTLMFRALLFFVVLGPKAQEHLSVFQKRLLY